MHSFVHEFSLNFSIYEENVFLQFASKKIPKIINYLSTTMLLQGLQNQLVHRLFLFVIISIQLDDVKIFDSIIRKTWIE